MKMTRQASLIQLLAEHETLTTDALAVQLGVSKRDHPSGSKSATDAGKNCAPRGRARLLHTPQQSDGEPFYARRKSHYADKADIARHALNWIEQGMTLALDASSTCFHLARQLPDIPLTVFTNSLPVCGEMARRQHINLICSGGRLERQNRCYVNPALVAVLYCFVQLR